MTRDTQDRPITADYPVSERGEGTWCIVIGDIDDDRWVCRTVCGSHCRDIHDNRGTQHFHSVLFMYMPVNYNTRQSSLRVLVCPRNRRRWSVEKEHVAGTAIFGNMCPPWISGTFLKGLVDRPVLIWRTRRRTKYLRAMCSDGIENVFSVSKS